jgi:hypothetical protein
MSNPTDKTQDILDLALAVKEAQTGLDMSAKYKDRLSADLDNVQRVLAQIKLDLVEADQQLAEATIKVEAAKAAFEAYIVEKETVS